MESYTITDEPINGSFEEFRVILDELASLGVSIGQKYGGNMDKTKLRPFSAISDHELYKIRGDEQSERDDEQSEEELQEDNKELKQLLSEEDNVDGGLDISSFLEDSFNINDALL